jgi:uncharacterized membrane protein
MTARSLAAPPARTSAAAAAPSPWRRLLALATLAWAGSLPAAAFAAAGRADGVAQALAVVVYGLGAWVCHQRPERSFSFESTPWPVCARCAGIYIGAALAAAWSLARPARVQPSPRRARPWLTAAAAPAALTLVYEWLVTSTPSNAVRAASGVPIGAVVTWLLVAALAPTVSRERSGETGSG